MNRVGLILFGCICLVSCAISSEGVVVAKKMPREYVLGYAKDRHLNGLWATTQVFGDGESMPHDTIWTLIMEAPRYIAYNDNFVLARNAKGKTLIMTTTPAGKPVYKSTRSEERYQELRSELSVPDSLVLHEIH